MASAPQENQNNNEISALALLLLSARYRYSLPALIRANRIRPRPFRQIRPTNALAANVAAPHFAIVRAWEAVIPDIIAALPYGQAAVASAIEQAAARVGITVINARAQFPDVIAAVERWHRAQWVSRVKASTGLDVSLLTQPQDVSDATAGAVSWNQSLADDVHQSIRSKLTAALLVAGITASGATALAGDVTAKARKRAAGIGTDQVRRLVRAMDRDRREAAGVTSYRWRHSPHVVHPRPLHVARDGKTFGNDEIDADDRCGVPYGCQCWEEAVLG